MKKFKLKGLGLVVAVLLAVSALAGCATTPSREGGGTVTFAIWSAAEGVFNFNLYGSRYDADSIDPIFDGMLKTNPDLSLKANIAHDWDISDDNLVFTYYLRDDIKFHDGEPLTAHDVKFTIEWMCHQDYTGVRFSNFQSIVGAQEMRDGEADEVTGIVVVNDHEIEFHMKEVDASAHSTISTWAISPKHIFDDGTPNGELENHPNIRKPIGCGPFKFVRWVEGQFIELERYDDYHLGAPKLERLIIKTANASVAQAELLLGNTDAAWVQPTAEDMEVYRATAGQPLELTIEEYPQNGYQYMAMNMRPGRIFEEKTVRHAATYAIDRWGILEGLLDGNGIVQVSHMSSVSWAYDPDLEPRPYDPEKAKQILDEAGWVVGSDGVRVKDGRKLEFTLLYPSGNPVRMDSAPIIQQNLEDVGFKVNLTMLEFNAMFDILEDMENRDFDANLGGWGLAADPDASSIWGNDSMWNFAGLETETNARLLREAVSVIDQDERKPYYIEWQKHLVEEAPNVWLYAGNEVYVFNSELKEFKPNPFGVFWDVHLWYWAD